MKNNTGFTLIELVAVLVLIGILAAVALPRFSGITEDAKLAQVAGVLGALRAGEQLVMAKYRIKGSPGMGSTSNTTLVIEGIPVRFNNGEIRTTLDSNHVPSVPDDPDNPYTRLFFLFIGNTSVKIVARDSNETGWAMLGNGGTCAAGPNPRRCWEFRSAGSRLARITYITSTGQFIQD